MKNTQLAPEELNHIAEAFARVPFAHLLRIRMGEVARGEAAVEMQTRPELTQNAGLVHGGAVASLLDTASAFAVMTLLETAETAVTVDLTIHYLRPIQSGKIEARARVLRAGRRLVTVSVDVRDGAGELAATAITTYLRKS